MAATVGHLQRLASHGVAFRSFTEEHLSTENELVRNILLATLASLAKLEREDQSDDQGWRARAKGKVLGRPKFSDGDRDKLIVALETGDSWHVVSRKTQRAAYFGHDACLRGTSMIPRQPTSRANLSKKSTS
jgi:DNA invertase Pin-like site-specific DNA recombinase